MRRRARMIIPGTTTLFAALDVKGQGNRIWSLRLLKAGSTSWGSGAVNSDRGCRNAEEPASVRSFARRKGSSAVNHLPDFSYAIALDSRNVAIKCAKVQTLVKDGQAEMVAHGLEIPIRMQQRVTTLNTKGADDHGDRLADGDALRSQQAIVRGDLRGQGGGQHGFDPVSPQCLLHAGRLGIVANALQDFDQHNVTDQDQ